MATLAIETALRDFVRRVVETTPVFDIHTHLFSPRFGGLLLWGIDELLTYHYLAAEVLRAAPMPYEQYWSMPKRAQADYVWQHLFVERSPVSEGCRGVLTVLRRLGLDVASRNLTGFRDYFASLSLDEYIARVLEIANVERLIMTNDPFDDAERAVWEQLGPEQDTRFLTALRIDPLLNQWETASARLQQWGYRVSGDLGDSDLREVVRFLEEWINRMSPRYMAVSLPPTFRFPEPSPRGTIIEKCILPVARRAGIPFALMIGVKKLVNPGLLLAGDSVGKADISALESLCTRYPDNRFLVTMLSRENQHELCVTARKYNNLHIFGCWWFLNNPSLIEEMTRMRLELLGLSVTPQHSDARVLDQLIYKWAHSREIIARVLADKYVDLAQAGWLVTEEEIRRDVGLLLGGEFSRFCGAVARSRQ